MGKHSFEPQFAMLRIYLNQLERGGNMKTRVINRFSMSILKRAKSFRKNEISSADFILI